MERGEWRTSSEYRQIVNVAVLSVKTTIVDGVVR